jgi:hypothetical protein
MLPSQKSFFPAQLHARRRQSAAPQGPQQGRPYRQSGPTDGPNGGVADSLDEAKAAFRVAPRLFVDARQKPKMRSRGEDFALVNRLLALSAAAQ